MTQIPTRKLNNGLEIPILGLGTYKEENEEKLIKAIRAAIDAGYRHFDCAYIYFNEKHIGKAIRDAIAESNGALTRSDFFITSKVFNNFHSRERVRYAIDQSLNAFGFDYLDLYLVHWPMGFKEGGPDFQMDENGKVIGSDIHYLETYHALEELVTEGRVKSIGVSNFNISQLQDVLDNCKIKPVCNQFEVHPLFQNKDLVSFCLKNDVEVVAYAPLGAPDRAWLKPEDPVLLETPFLLELSRKHNKTPAQVILRWLIQRGIIPIPKSVTPSRIQENSQVFDFELSADEMSLFDSFKDQFRFYAFEVSDNHKFYPF